MVRMAILGLFFSSSALAGSMQLRQQGRILDASGGAVEGTHNLTFTILDGSDNPLFTESYPTLTLSQGYYAVDLGSSANLDTAVFLDHGATHLQIQVDGNALSDMPLGGYPAMVAHQSSIDLRLEAFLEHQVPTSCPSGMSMINEGTERAFCIEPTRRGTSSYQPAEATCASLGRHMCTQTEWFQGKTQLGGANFCNQGTWEWLGTMGERGAADGDLHLIAGRYADCQHYNWGWTGFSASQSGPYAYRCCVGQSAAQFR